MKLVRDGYEQGRGFTLRKVDSRLEHIQLLKDKIHEELLELLSARTRDDAAVESGDLIEAIICYGRINWGLSEGRIFEDRDRKSDKLGDFTKGTVWVEG